jgi:hypothetical protein
MNEHILKRITEANKQLELPNKSIKNASWNENNESSDLATFN